MNEFVKKYWKTLVFFALAGLIGGFFTGLYLLNNYSEVIVQEIIDDMNEAGLGAFPVEILLGVTTAIQSAFYGLLLGAVGIFLGKKTGLWKDEVSITKKPLVCALAISVVGGLMLILPDMLYFGKHNQAIMESYAVKPNVITILASVIYGGVIEEVMLRLFFMSLIAFILFKIFKKRNLQSKTWVLVVANVIAAILFAVGHLPATILLLGSSSMLIFRCFLLNGAFGLLFGWLFRKYGLRYSMIAHGGCHIISKLIWILFI